MYNVFDNQAKKDDDKRKNNIPHPDVLEADILRIKLLLDNLLEELSSNSEFSQDSIKNSLKELRKKSSSILSTYRTSAETEIHAIIRTIKEATDELSVENLIQNLKKHSDSISINLSNWIGWYKREYKL